MVTKSAKRPAQVAGDKSGEEVGAGKGRGEEAKFRLATVALRESTELLIHCGRAAAGSGGVFGWIVRGHVPMRDSHLRLSLNDRNFV